MEFRRIGVQFLAAVPGDDCPPHQDSADSRRTCTWLVILKNFATRPAPDLVVFAGASQDGGDGNYIKSGVAIRVAGRWVSGRGRVETRLSIGVFERRSIQVRMRPIGPGEPEFPEFSMGVITRLNDRLGTGYPNLDLRYGSSEPCVSVYEDSENCS